MPSVRAGLAVLVFLMGCEAAAPPPANPQPVAPPPPPVAPLASPAPDTFEPDYYQACDSPLMLAKCRTFSETVAADAGRCTRGPECEQKKERAVRVQNRVAQLEKIQALQQDSTRRQAESVAAVSAAEKALQDRLAKERADAAWRAAPNKCVQDLSDQACADPNAQVSDADRDECRRRCENGTADWMKDHVDAALKACFLAYEGGDHQAACKVDLPSTASDARRARIGDLLQDCSKVCVHDGGDFVRARRAGPGLVASYKQCMSTTLSTAAVRRIKDNDAAAYNDLFGRTDVRCRPLGRCDWVEKFTDLQCAYSGN